MKTRIIKTTYWEDETILRLNPETRGFYLYLLTNAKVNIIGIYELPEMYMQMQTGYSTEQLQAMKAELARAGRCGFEGPWVILVNALKHNNYIATPFNKNSTKKEIDQIPPKIKEFIASEFPALYQSLYTTIYTTVTVLSTVLINNKQKRRGGVGEKQTNSFSEEKYPFRISWEVTDWNLASPEDKEKISNAIYGRLYEAHPGWTPPANTPADLQKLFMEQQNVVVE